MENDNPSQEYVKGFNYGYIVAKYIPDLAHQLSKTASPLDRFIGLKDGIGQYEKEYLKDSSPDWLKKDRLVSRSQAKDIQKDKPEHEKE